MIIVPKKMCDGHIEYRTYSHLFHTTHRDNVDSILRKGLKPSAGHCMVFLSTEASSWRHVVGEDKPDEEEVTLIVNIDGLEGKFTDFLPDLDEVNYWGTIPPDRIQRVEDFTKAKGL